MNSQFGGISMFMLDDTWTFLTSIQSDIPKPIAKVPGLQEQCISKDQGEMCRVKSAGKSQEQYGLIIG